MSRYATKSGFVEISFDLKAYETRTIDFLDVQPNYYRVQNMGSSKLYCGVSKMPTTEDYDFVVKPEGLKLYAEPFKRGFLYLFNPSGSPTKGKIVAFAAEFDPLSLALSDIEIDMSDVALTTVTAIDEFRAALPAGTNNIGRVTIANFPNDYAKSGNQKDYTSGIADILTGVSNLVSKISALYGFHTDRYMEIKSGTATSAETVYSMNGNYHIIELGFYSNDGDAEQQLAFADVDGTTHVLSVKAGEVVNNLSGDWASLKVSGSGAYRMAYTLGKVS